MAKINNQYDVGAAFEAIEDELMASMIRNMQRHKVEEIGDAKQWSMWQAEMLHSLEKYRHDNQKKFGKQFQAINSKITGLIQAAQIEGGTAQETKILDAIRKGFPAKQTTRGGTAEFLKINDRKLNALIEATQNDMQSAEAAVLRMANDQYRKIIFNAQMYANSGAGTYEKAVDMATKDFLSAGLNCIQYANGARHTIADYADMAIRTASKRAYLQGEGQKRQEWGICTVIMNKRGSPCPKCLPFVGKVLIDDVWSGGPKSGKSPVTGIRYPLMSSAIAAGLYHPRCQDHHSTYFEGISEPPDDKYTRDELNDLADQARQEAKQQYAARQEKRFGRLAEYSLDPENQKRYELKRKEWRQVFRECGNKGRNKSTLMDRKEIGSNHYRRKINSLPESKEICREIWSEMVNIISQRSGTELESLVFINTETNEIKRSLESKLLRTVAPTKKMKQMLQQSKEHTIIAIHNHPGSSVPSWADIKVAADRKYKYGLIAAHDGTVFKYRIIGEINRLYYDSAVAKLDRLSYTEDNLKEFCNAVRDAGVEMEVL